MANSKPFLNIYLWYLLPPGRRTYCLFWVKKCIFSVFIFYALFGMLLKGMGEKFLLFRDEPLTPVIDGVIAL